MRKDRSEKTVRLNMLDVSFVFHTRRRSRHCSFIDRWFLGRCIWYAAVQHKCPDRYLHSVSNRVNEARYNRCRVDRLVVVIIPSFNPRTAAAPLYRYRSLQSYRGQSLCFPCDFVFNILSRTLRLKGCLYPRVRGPNIRR